MTWFDEFDFRLGAAMTTPPTNAWQNGVWRRDFERGIALVNPTKQTVSVAVEPGFRRLLGKQDPAVNDGKPATSIVLEAKGGIILRREQRAAAEPVRIIFDTDMDSDSPTEPTNGGTNPTAQPIASCCWRTAPRSN